MADANQVAEDLARTLQRVNDDLAQFGKITQQTKEQLVDAEMKAKYGVENFTKGTAAASDAIMALGAAGFAAGKAMLDGKKGAAAFNGSLDEMSKAATAAGLALTLLIPGGPLIKGLIAGITMAAGAYIKYTQAANEMADKLYKGYQGLSKAGGAAADGMMGVKASAQKLNLTMDELDQMVSIVAENSKEFALFAGSVSQGRKAFADIGEQVHKSDAALFNMGMSVKDINEGTAGYLKLQTRLGNAQKMTTDQLAKGAVDYLKEQDALTKLTGQSRAEMEQQRERALQKEQFAAKIRELQMNGQHKAAESLLKLNSIYEAAGPETASAFQASVTGNLSNRDAQKANLASQGEMIRSTQMVIDGQISYQEAAQRTGKAMGETADRVGTTLGQLGVYNENFGNLAEQLKLGQMASGDIVTNFNKIKQDQAAQVAGVDANTKKMGELISAQIDANKAMTNFVAAGIGPATDKMIALANATGAAARGLEDMTGGKASTEEKLKAGGAGALAGAATGAAIGSVVPIIGTAVGGAVGAVLGGLGGYLYAGSKTADERKEGARGAAQAMEAADYPSAAEGGYLTGPKSGYMAMLHGNELVIPEDQLQGKVQTGGAAGAGGEQYDKLTAMYKEILKDTQTLEKLTDTDLKKTQTFSRLQDKVFTLKTALMEDEVELLEEQNDQLQKLLDAIEKSSGKDAAAAMKRSMTMQRMGGMSMGGMSMGMGGGQGLTMGQVNNITSMGGGQGLQVTNQDQLSQMGLKLKKGDVQAEGAGISPKLIELAKAVQSGIPGFNQFTGFNDKFHNEKSPSSQHTKGLAMDFTLVKEPTKQEGDAIVNWLKQAGASLAIDEYNNPSSQATAGHIHAQIPAFKDGGLVDEATLSLIGEGGPEAVIPLKDGNVPVSFNGNIGLGDEALGLFRSMAEQTAMMAAMMEEMVKAQKNSVDVQNKMLRAQS